MISYAIIGTGWRAEFFARVAQFLPQQFNCLGFVTKDAAGRERFEKLFGLKSYNDFDALIKAKNPKFAVVCVSHGASADVAAQLAQKGLPVLIETPVTDEHLQKLPKNAKAQVAEQYFVRPVQQAHLKLLASGLLGKPVEARVSLTNTYHAVSLLRKYLDVENENPLSVQAITTTVRGTEGYGRGGVSAEEIVSDKEHILAIIRFAEGKTGIYDFEDMQHRSFIRTSVIQVKCERGEIFNDRVSYLPSHSNPAQTTLRRVNMGEDANIEGFGLKNITANGIIYYTNPYPNSRLTDDEIAVAQALEGMARYIETGADFYSVASAAKDSVIAARFKFS